MAKPKTPLEDVRQQLHRSQKNEKLLMDKVKELTRQRASLIKADTDLKKEQLEVAKLKKMITKQDLHVEKLRKDLMKTKTDLRNEETERAYEKKTSETKIFSLEKECLELTNKYSVENELRKQKEREMEKLPSITENKRLTDKVEDVSHQLHELIGYKHFAEKKIDELNQLVKDKDVEHNKTKALMGKVKIEAKQFIELKEEMNYYKDRLQNEQKEKEKVVQEITEHRKQADSDKKTIYHLMQNNEILTKKNRECNSTNQTLEQKLELLKQNKASLALAIENHNKEAEKQRNLIQSLEIELNNFSNKNTKLEDRFKEAHVSIKNKDLLIIDDRSHITDLQNQITLQKKQIEADKYLKSQIMQNVLKAKMEIEGNNKTIQHLNDEIRAQSDEINRKNMELDQFKEKYTAVKKHVEGLKKTLAKLEQKHKDFIASASKDQEFEKEKNAKMIEEMARYEKELICYREMVTQQQVKIDIQMDAKRKQEQELKDYKEQSKIFRAELSEKENALNHANQTLQMMLQNTDFILVNIQKEKTRDKMQNLAPKPQKRNRQYQLSGRKFASHQWKGKMKHMQTQLEEKDKKIDELKSMLARRPDDAIQKLHESKWNNRELNKKLKASQGRAMAYEAQYKNVSEENNRLTNEIRKFKLESINRSKYVCLPPISRKSQPVPPSENKPDDQLFLGGWLSEGHTNQFTPAGSDESGAYRFE
ncbi:hypothetical protein PAMP_022166 [Pampus punctatissimus]